MGCGIYDTQPASRWQDAFAAGNGRHGALVHGDPAEESVIVTHHGITAPSGTAMSGPPLLAGDLEATRDLLIAGQPEKALTRFGGDWPLIWPRSFHPAFAVRLSLAGQRAPAGYRREVDFQTGVVTTRWSDPAGQWRRTCFVSRARDLVVQHLQVPGDGSLRLTVRHDVALAGALTGLTVRGETSIRRGEATLGVVVGYPETAARDAVSAGDAGSAGASAPAGDAIPAGNPGPEGYAGATRVIAPGGQVTVHGATVLVTGGREVLLLTRVTPCQHVPVAPALQLPGLSALAGVTADYEQLAAEHAARHRADYGEVTLELPAAAAQRCLPVSELLALQAAQPDTPLPALLEKLFDSGRYLLLASSGQLPPRLTGLWQGDWESAWSGAIVTDANLGIALAGAVSAGVAAAPEALAQMIDAHIDDWRLNARALYGADGILAPVTTDGSNGRCYHFSTDYPLHMWTGAADWLAACLLEHAEATGDRAFTARKVTPLLAELARFYESFLTRAGANGELVILPSYSPENSPAGQPPAAINATIDIAAARHALTQASRLISAGAPDGTPQGYLTDPDPDPDPDPEAASGEERAAAAARWRTLAGRLPSYRVNADGALAEWAWPAEGEGAPLPDRYRHRHVSHLYPVWPLREITPDDTPDLAAAALRALQLREDEDGSAHGLIHRGLAAARLRDSQLAGEALTALTGGGYFFGSLMSSHYPKQSVYNADAALGLPGLIIGMMVGSAPPREGPPGRVELVPAVPGFLPAGQLRGVRTVTGVVVDLRWDIPAAAVSATLTSASTQQIEVACALADTLAASPVVATPVVAGPVAAGPVAAGTSVRQTGRGCWRLRLPASEPVEVTARWRQHQ